VDVWETGRASLLCEHSERVLGDLSDLGYDAAWYGLRAADVGAPHGRFRVFVAAYPASDAGRRTHGDGAAPTHANGRAEHGQRSRQELGEGGSLLPTPATSDTNGAGRHGDGGLDLRTAVTLLPTPSSARPTVTKVAARVVRGPDAAERRDPATHAQRQRRHRWALEPLR
jgi:site-specific DNA-cytosine methylase